MTNAQKRELEFREGFLTDDPGAILFNVMLREFKFHEILEACYPIKPGNTPVETVGNMLFSMIYFGANKFDDFRVMNFKGLELLIGTYSVPGERTVRKLVNGVMMADVVTGAGMHPSIIDRLIESECDMRAVGEFRRRFIKVYHELGIVDCMVVYVDGHFKPYWGNVNIPKGFSRMLNKPMKGIYEFFGHDVNGNAICSIELPGDANLLDGTDFIKREIATALGPGYAELLVVDREGMSGGQLEKYEDETRSILGILRTSSNVQKQLDAVEITEVYETDPNGNPSSMISDVQLVVPNYRVRETIENGKKKKVNGTLDCAAIYNLKTGNKYAIAHTVKDDDFTKEEAVGLYKKRFPVQENDFKSKKVNGGLDTLHGYDFYEVENRQYENWLEAKESNIRGHERSLNARKGEISRLKKKVERAVQRIRDFRAEIKRKREKKREIIARETVIIATAARDKTKETHRATLNGLEKELVGLEEIHEEKQKETHEKVAGYTVEIKEKEKEIERLGSEIEGINKRIEKGGPEPMYEMNTALMCFIIALLVLRDNIHTYLMKEFFGEPFVKMGFHTAYKCIYRQQAKVKLIDDVLYIMYEKVPNRWHNGMKEAFKKINGKGYTTKEGWRIQLEI